MQSRIQQLTSSTGIRQSLISIVGNTAATAVSAIALLLISRNLGPARFSQFSVGFAIIIMLNKFNDAGLNAAIIKYAGATESLEKQQGIFSFTARIKIILSLCILIIGLLISPWLSAKLHFAEPTIIYMSFILSLISSWYEHLLAVLQSLHRFTQAVAVNALQSSAKLVGTLLLAFVQLHGSIPVFGWYMMSPLVPLLFVRNLLPVKLALWSTQHSLQKVERQQIIAMAQHSALGFIAAGLIENIDILFVQFYLTDYETGLLGGISRIAMMVNLIAYSLGNVLYPRVARYKTQVDLTAYLKKAWIIAGGSVLGFVAFIPFSKLLILLTIGDQYLPGVGQLNMLAASSFLTLATIPFLALFYSFKANWYFSISGILQLAIVILGNIIFVPSLGLDAAVWTRLAARGFLFVFTITTSLLLYRANHKELNDASAS